MTFEDYEIKRMELTSRIARDREEERNEKNNVLSAYAQKREQLKDERRKMVDDFDRREKSYSLLESNAIDVIKNRHRKFRVDMDMELRRLDNEFKKGGEL